MKNLRAERQLFRRELVKYGASNVEQLKAQYPLGCTVPDEVLEAWHKRMFRPVQPVYRKEPRLINRFKLGADPEFVFASGGRRINASDLNLKTGRAFGADLNGRLVEIRPKAYRSALKVVASTLHTMRWLQVQNPMTADLEWKTGAYLWNDGLGGHVHLGRKKNLGEINEYTVRNKRGNVGEMPLEVEALDRISDLLIALNVYPAKEITARRNGDDHGQMYGLPGDVRIQSHGYEYRTFPSWIDNPYLAFFTLTLSKLAVFDPELVLAWRKKSWDSVQLLLSYYRGRDDDALLLEHLMRRSKSPPAHIGGDFRGRWGLLPKVVGKAVKLIPMAMSAPKNTVREIFDLFESGKPLVPMTPDITWSPSDVPKNYRMALDGMRTAHTKGIGEIFWDAVTSVSLPLQLAGTDGYGLILSEDMRETLPDGWLSTLKKIDPQVQVSFTRQAEDRPYLYIGSKLREPENVALTRKLLFSGVFPLWKAKDVLPASFRDWEAARAVKPKRSEGKILYEGVI